MFNHITIVGLGLLGGSLGLAIKEQELASSVTGIARKQETLNKALALKAIDQGQLNLDPSISDSDLIVLCAPVNQIIKDISLLSHYIDKDTLVTDVGSTKVAITSAGHKYLSHFVGSHPLAGSEQSGIDFANSNLFKNRTCIVTMDPQTNISDLNKVEDFWVSLGSKVSSLSPAEHDRILSFTSHLPHMMAANLLHSLALKDLEFVAQGFWDTSRLASGSPSLWTDICETNQTPLLEAIDSFETSLKTLKALLKNKDKEALCQWLKSAKKKRDSTL